MGSNLVGVYNKPKKPAEPYQISRLFMSSVSSVGHGSLNGKTQDFGWVRFVQKK